MQELAGNRKQMKALTQPRRPFRQERLDAICRQLAENGYVSVNELSERTGVSSATIRSDLEWLEQNGRLLRTHGGAVPFQLNEGALSFAVRQRENVAAKERIGAAAAEYVSDGEAIVLDASTTAWQMAKHLINRRDLTVVTTGLYVALELLRAPGITVIIPGGAVWREAASIIGPLSAEFLERGNLQKGFFSGRGLSILDGLTDANQAEVELKRQLISAVRQVNVIVDAS
ncbi:MAG: DeoR/GlpR family DNA-binding transcription regulator, partial [Chloroflexi bacterium]|nr:DeoR/GlpR family DNA-binding transcription regulator [Chloroflexota bacterium]